MKTIILGIVLFGALFTNGTQGGSQKTESWKIDDLVWMSGDWQMAPGQMQSDEHWTTPYGGTMFGTSRTVAGGKTVFFEYLRIETRADGLYYVAHPKARNPGTDFKLVKLEKESAVFENLKHDFPKRILYRKSGKGLTARIEGDGTEKEKPQEFNFRRMAQPSGG